MSCLVGQNSNIGNYTEPMKRFQSKINWVAPPEGWIKFDVDASVAAGSTTIEVIGKDTTGDTV